ncbi:hypothetical protein [Pseudomonas frederiksbergensis]|uniref:DUF4124 domain-containing protein n=1 Tax=Pseudomonas frederiksbergensis TaxID=104087 RepID=A0A423K2P4_9PSED|nr:hypothetical protein [Pseudomonas frederiksbergensis]RON45666.1 hypothetical protein BK665_29530 [Pseudomonas frederiksbergensis]
MKPVSLIFASLLLVGSASAFAEGGAERMKHHWDNFPVHSAQPQSDHRQNGELRVPDDQTAQVTETYRN